MSYNLSINGHVAAPDAEAELALAEELERKALEFVASLEGVTSATLTAHPLGLVNLVAPA